MPPPPGDWRAAVVANQLHSAAIHLLRRVRAQDDAMGLTAPLASALSVIVFGGPLSLGALATAEQVRPPSITRIVRELEARGLVVREGTPRDRPGGRGRSMHGGRGPGGRPTGAVVPPRAGSGGSRSRFAASAR